MEPPPPSWRRARHPRSLLRGLYFLHLSLCRFSSGVLHGHPWAGAQSPLEPCPPASCWALHEQPASHCSLDTSDTLVPPSLCLSDGSAVTAGQKSLVDASHSFVKTRLVVQEEALGGQDRSCLLKGLGLSAHTATMQPTECPSPGLPAPSLPPVGLHQSKEKGGNHFPGRLHLYLDINLCQCWTKKNALGMPEHSSFRTRVKPALHAERQHFIPTAPSFGPTKRQ